MLWVLGSQPSMPSSWQTWRYDADGRSSRSSRQAGFVLFYLTLASHCKAPPWERALFVGVRRDEGLRTKVRTIRVVVVLVRKSPQACSGYPRC